MLTSTRPLLSSETARARLAWLRRTATSGALTLAMLHGGDAHAQAPLPIGDELQINTFTERSQRNPAVAMDADGDMVTVWESCAQDGSRYGIYAQRFDAEGLPSGEELRVNT